MDVKRVTMNHSNMEVSEVSTVLQYISDPWKVALFFYHHGPPSLQSCSLCIQPFTYWVIKFSAKYGSDPAETRIEPCRHILKGLPVKQVSRMAPKPCIIQSLELQPDSHK